MSYVRHFLPANFQPPFGWQQWSESRQVQGISSEHLLSAFSAEWRPFSFPEILLRDAPWDQNGSRVWSYYQLCGPVALRELRRALSPGSISSGRSIYEVEINTLENGVIVLQMKTHHAGLQRKSRLALNNQYQRFQYVEMVVSLMHIYVLIRHSLSPVY